MMKSAEYKRGYDAGYKQALLDALKDLSGMAASLSRRKLSPAKEPMTQKFGVPFGAVD